MSNKVNWCFLWDLQSTWRFQGAGLILSYRGDLRNTHRMSTPSPCIPNFTQATCYTSSACISHSSAHLAHQVLVTLSRKKYADLNSSLTLVSLVLTCCPTLFQKHHLDISFPLSSKAAAKAGSAGSGCSACFAHCIPYDTVKDKRTVQSDYQRFSNLRSYWKEDKVINLWSSPILNVTKQKG